MPAFPETPDDKKVTPVTRAHANTPATPRSGGEILADGLIANGVTTLFGVPGESFLGLLDAIHDRADRLRFVCARQEGGAAFMADAYAKLTGTPGVCVVTRGPGACNASIGVHTAQQDSTPMIVLIGQVSRGHREREAFQEVEYRHMFAPMAKWVCEVDSAARFPEHLSHAFHLAQSGRPGPVVMVLPEDVLSELATVPDLPAATRIRAAAGAGDVDRVLDALATAERPLCILGGPGWSSEAKQAFETFAAANALPVVTSLRCQDYFDNTNAAYAGDLGVAAHPEIAARVRDADLLLVLGARLGEMTSQGYTAPEPPRAPRTLAHIYPDAAELGRVYRPDIPVVADISAFALALSDRALPPSDTRAAWTAEANATYRDLLAPPPQPGALDMGRVMQALAERLPEDTIFTNGAGNYSAWIHKYRQFRTYRSQLAPTSGAMGYGLPAATAAKIAAPDRQVVCFAGDGCFQMNGQELGTIMQNGLAPLIVVVNNGIYGTIRMHQEREFPGHVHGTDIVNPDFAALARAYGFHAETLERTEDIGPALDRALAAKGAALVECRIDPEGIAPRATLSGIREKALARRSGA